MLIAIVLCFIMFCGRTSFHLVMADDCPPPAPCEQPQNARLPFCNPALPLDARVKDLVSRIPLNQTSTLFSANSGAVPSVLLPPYNWGSEALHGVANSGGVHYFGNISNSTSFPQVCTTGASFNKTLFSQIGDLIGREARAMNNLCHAGLTFWAPNINIFRDPRWGRGQEVAGEDPYLVSAYVTHFVRAMQNNSMDRSRLRVSSCCKHYTAYDVELWGGVTRHNFSAVVSDYDLTMSFMPPFEACVHRDAGDSSGVMCSYNALNGVPMCANGPLLSEKARGEWGFNGYIVTDCHATKDVYYNYKYAKTPGETIRVVLNAGVDIACGPFMQQNIDEALKDGAVSESTVRLALSHQFAVLFRLGYFDAASLQPYKKLNANDVNTREAQAVALQAAHEGITLLLNRDELLPLSTAKFKSIAVMGPNAAANWTMLGDYYGQPPFIVTPLDGIRQHCAATAGCSVEYIAGLDSVLSTNVEQFSSACELAARADIVLLFVGNNQTVESEGRDRMSISFPGMQNLFVHEVASCAANRSSVVVVAFSGGSIDYAPMMSHPSVGAILWAGYPGQSAGQAIADILFGSVSPSGRLPHTVYPARYVDQVSMLDMEMSANATSGSPGRTYRYYTGQVVFPFGHGLTYTRWKVTQVPSPNQDGSSEVTTVPLNIQNALHDPSVIPSTLTVASIWVNVTNVGDRAGSFSVLLFVTPDPPGPLIGGSLADFVKLHLAPGESKVVELDVKAHAVVSFDAHSPSKRRLRHGAYRWRIPDGCSGTLHLLS